MPHPFITLGVRDDASDGEVREAYLRKVHEFPPEQAPQRFQEVCEAYGAVKDEVARARIRVFGLARPWDELAALAPPTENARHRIGMDLWQKLLREKADA